MFGNPPQAPNGVTGGNKTRIQNTMNRARQASMGGNIAAVNSIRQVTGPKKKVPKSSVSDYSSAGDNFPDPQQAQGSSAGNSPYNISALSVNMGDTQPEDPVQRYNRDAAIDRIISSPDMMDTVTRLKLRNHFQGRDDEGLGVEALGIVKSMHGLTD